MWEFCPPPRNILYTKKLWLFSMLGPWKQFCSSQKVWKISHIFPFLMGCVPYPAQAQQLRKFFSGRTIFPGKYFPGQCQVYVAVMKHQQKWDVLHFWRGKYIGKVFICWHCSLTPPPIIAWQLVFAHRIIPVQFTLRMTVICKITRSYTSCD